MASWNRGHFFWKERGGECILTRRPQTRRPEASKHTSDLMIIFLVLDLKQIALNSRDYPWPQPDCCGRCCHPKLWGHGFVPMIFEGFAQALQMRRYRCPKCGCVIRVRPEGFFSRHQSDVATIRRTLEHRIAAGRWPRGGVTNRARHWLAALKRHALAVWGLAALDDLMAAFDRLLAKGRVPVSRAV